MSRLKIRLAKKLTDSGVIGEVLPEDIFFIKNGNRGDVVRWEALGYECFISGLECVKNGVTFSLGDTSNEIYVENY